MVSRRLESIVPKYCEICYSDLRVGSLKSNSVHYLNIINLKQTLLQMCIFKYATAIKSIQKC